MTTLITGGTVVNATGTVVADVLIDGEKVVAVVLPGSTALGADLAATAGDNQLTSERLSSRMLLQVHDELVFEVPGPELESVRALVREEMEGAATLSVPLVVDVGTGRNWLETKL